MAGSDALMKLLDATLVAFVVHGAQAFDSCGGIAGWCRVNGVSRATFYRHLDRVRADGAWTARSRPHRSPGAVPAVVADAVVALRASLAAAGSDNGAVSIRYHLGQDESLQGLAIPSPATIHKILVARGLVSPQPLKRPRSSWRRFSYARPRDCYQIDATIVTLAGGAQVRVFEVLDDATRTLVATRAAATENATDAIAALTAAFSDFGVPAIVLSDNGTAFTSRRTGGGTSRFTRVVTDAGARLIHASPYHPQTCGKVERHHRTFKTWLITQPAPVTVADLQALSDRYQHWYNTIRPHTANGGIPPASAWELAAATPDGLGGPQHLPLQRDALVATRTVNHVGTIRTGARTTVSVGKHRAGSTVTIVQDGHHVTVYDTDGIPLGHLLIDPTKKHQGRLSTAA